MRMISACEIWGGGGSLLLGERFWGRKGGRGGNGLVL